MLGFAFWIVAARLFPSSVVGRDGALVSAMIIFSTVCQLNLGAAMLRFLPIVKLDPGRTVLAAYGVTAAHSTTAAGTLFVTLAPDVSHNYGFLRQDSAIAVVYIAAAAAWGVFALQDAVLTALRRRPGCRSRTPPSECSRSLRSRFCWRPSWSRRGLRRLGDPDDRAARARQLPDLPPRAAGSACARERALSVERFGRVGLARFLTQEYLASIFSQGASTLLPILIVGFIGSRQNAYFYIPFMIVSSFDLVFLNVTSSLTVEGALATSRLPALMRMSVRRFRPLLVGGVLALIVGANVVLLPFGAEYVRGGGATVLRVLAAASAFRVIGRCSS